MDLPSLQCASLAVARPDQLRSLRVPRHPAPGVRTRGAESQTCADWNGIGGSDVHPPALSSELPLFRDAVHPTKGTLDTTITKKSAPDSHSRNRGCVETPGVVGPRDGRGSVGLSRTYDPPTVTRKIISLEYQIAALIDNVPLADGNFSHDHLIQSTVRERLAMVKKGLMRTQNFHLPLIHNPLGG